MIAIDKEMITEHAKKLNLVFWQVTDGTTEIGRQDEEILLNDSLEQLNELLTSLQQYSKPGDRVKVAMQNQKMTEKGRVKGQITRTWYVALQPSTGPSISGYNSFNSTLQKENESLKLEILKRDLEEKHQRERAELLKRIEALEEEPEVNDIDKTIGHINTLLAHPLAQMLVSQFMQSKPAAPAINGTPQESEQLFNEWLKLDSDAPEVLKAIILIAKNQPENYKLYKSMLLK